MQYRIRFASDGGLVEKGNRKGWPVATKPRRTLLAALRDYRAALKDARVGVELGIAMQCRLFASEPWQWIADNDVRRYAEQYRVKL